jgi:hypothetical protein
VYTVVFTKKALDDITSAWLASESTLRAAVTAAMTVLEEELRSDPNSVSESRETGFRIGFAPPLAYLFEVSDADRRVKVFHIWLWNAK